MIVTAARLAVRVTVRVEKTADVVIVKFFDVAPAGTVTVPGSDAEGSFEVMSTFAPAVGAAFEMVTVPALFTPPCTDVGFTVNPVRIN